MQFKHPEILWALFLLIIPIIIHLFQLRKFQKEAFTNVAFLKQLNLQTRKSSQLKKWLVLLTRLLALASVIIAFTEPYFANRNIKTTAKETVIYLDNSYSMELKGSHGTLLQESINQLIKNIPETEVFSLFTNTDSYKDVKITAIKNELLTDSYSSTQLELNEVFLKGNQLFSDKNTIKDFILLSDFQQREPFKIDSKEDETLYFVQLQPSEKNNIAIDSVYIDKKELSTYELKVQVSKNYPVDNLPIALYDGDKLIAKTAVTFENNLGTAILSVPSGNLKGKISIEDNGLQYDNSLYFSINKNDNINVLAINNADDNFLKKIFTEDEFNYTNTPTNAIDYNSIQQQNLIVLNELKVIPNSLITTLLEVKKQGASILIIPSVETDLNTYNQLFKNISNTSIVSLNKKEKQITTIAFDHPLFKNVFDAKVTNFQYPKTKISYSLLGTNENVISYTDNTPFLAENNGIYIFTSPLNKEVGNFQNSPLIVPTLYNIAKQSLALPNLYYTIGKNITFDVKAKLTSDEILTIENKNTSFIPLQQTYSNHISITTTNLPKEAGVYTITKNKEEFMDVSFNFSRKESELNYLDINTITPKNTFSNIPDAFKNIKSENNVDELWKWFVIFALVFLCIELLILKYFK
ncbi:MAG: BatA domain-containing protein [Galbibacter orientalis]|uniref:BatA domain-containing protein n=1 Tax=Galbibacter orientalis TaxID=453852 RepID=UPI003002A3C8